MKNIRIIIILVLLGASAPHTWLCAQSASSPISIRLVNRDGDTVLYKRSASDWRIGPALSATLHYHYGKLVLPITPDLPCNGFYVLNAGQAGGGGMTAGLAFDYQVPGDRWGLTFLANLYDYRSTTSYTRIPGAPVSTDFIVDNTITSNASLQYVSLMPQARLNIAAYPGLHVLMGVDVDLKVSQHMQRLTTHYDLERIDVVRTIPFEAGKMRIGASVGLGWDALAGVIDNYRMTLTPFVNLHGGSKIYSSDGSTWNSVYVQCGVALKFGSDDVSEEVIKRMPGLPEPQVPTIARSDDKIKVQMAESKGLFIEMLVPTIHEAAPVAVVESPVNPTPSPAPLKIPFNGRMVPNNVQVFSTYNSALDTTISPKLRGYLDAVADYLQKNPTAELRIIGHADSYGGSPVETQRVSDERALQIVRFLMRKGISRDRLLASGMGARTPIQSNRTMEGRAANRRIELTIVH